MSEWCGNCRFFHPQTSKAFPSTDGVCRRHAPRGPAILSGSGWSVFPPMMVWHWCGDHQKIALAAMRKRLGQLDELVKAKGVDA